MRGPLLPMHRRSPAHTREIPCIRTDCFRLACVRRAQRQLRSANKPEVCLSTHTNKQLADWPSASQRVSGHTLCKSSVRSMLMASKARWGGPARRSPRQSLMYEQDAILARRRFASAEQHRARNFPGFRHDICLVRQRRARKTSGI